MPWHEEDTLAPADIGTPELVFPAYHTARTCNGTGFPGGHPDRRTAAYPAGCQRTQPIHWFSRRVIYRYLGRMCDRVGRGGHRNHLHIIRQTDYHSADSDWRPRLYDLRNAGHGGAGAPHISAKSCADPRIHEHHQLERSGTLIQMVFVAGADDRAWRRTAAEYSFYSHFRRKAGHSVQSVPLHQRILQRKRRRYMLWRQHWGTTGSNLGTCCFWPAGMVGSQAH